MSGKAIICIGRQYGSGGKMIGKTLAEKLHLPFYDNELITKVSDESGLSEEVVKSEEERNGSKFFYSPANISYLYGTRYSSLYGMNLNDKIYNVQCGIIENIAKQGPAVIVGRCADFVLKDLPNVVSVFIYANLEMRMERVVKYYGVAESKARDTVIKTDKRRANYYNFYTNAAWGKADNYDICIGSEIGIDETVRIIENYVDIFEKKYLSQK